MTTFELNAELFRELSIIAGDEGMMLQALKALRRITNPTGNLRTLPQERIEAIDWNNLPELPADILELRGSASISEEDLAKDSRLSYIMSK